MDYLGSFRPSKEGRTPAALTLVLTASLLAGCVSAADCKKRIPDDLRADAMRYALEAALIPLEAFSPDEQDYLLANGTPSDQLSRERKAEITPHALGFANCMRDRLR